MITLNSIIENIDIDYFKFNLNFHKYVFTKLKDDNFEMDKEFKNKLLKRINLLSYISGTCPDILKYFINDDYTNYKDDLTNEDLVNLINIFSDEEPIKLSVNLIVYNEQRCIERCLSSISTFADEILVLDTGSTDDTVKIIEEKFPNVKLFKDKWRKDFAYSRNILIDKSSNDWILSIDADETPINEFYLIKDVISLFKNFKANSDHPLVFSPTIDSLGQKINTTKRIFNKTHEMKFDGKIHEEIISKNDKPINYIMLNLTLSHDGYQSDVFKEKNKAERNTEILEKMIKLEPNKIRWYYFLGREKNILGHNVDDCIKILKSGLKLRHTQNSIENFYYNILTLLAKIAVSHKKYDLLKEVIELMEYEIPNSLDAFYFKLILENDSVMSDKFNQINEMVESIGDITDKVNTIDETYSHILHTLGLIYLSFRDYTRAFYYFNQIQSPKNIEVIKNLLTPLKENIDQFFQTK